MKHILQKFFSDEEIDIINQNELEFSEIGLAKFKEQIIKENGFEPNIADVLIEIAIENTLIKKQNAMIDKIRVEPSVLNQEDNDE